MRGRRIISWLMLAAAIVLSVSLDAAAQFTQVTGTVTDPLGIPYANGTVVPALVTSATPVFTATGQAYTPPTQPSGLNSSGFFSMQLADVTQLTPAGSTWKFLVCSALGSVPPAVGKGSVCFTVSGISISGSSQDISTTLNASAPPLSTKTGSSFLGGLGNSSSSPTAPMCIVDGLVNKNLLACLTFLTANAANQTGFIFDMVPEVVSGNIFVTQPGNGFSGNVFLGFSAHNANICSINSGNCSEVGNTVSCTCNGNHNLQSQEWVSMTGGTPSGFNGDYQVTVTGLTTFQYTDPTGSLGSTSTAMSESPGCGESPPTCLLTTSPLMLNSSMSIFGSSTVTGGTGGTPIAPDVTFPPGLGCATWSVAPTCSGSGGSIATGTYSVAATWVNNKVGGSTNPKSPGYSCPVETTNISCTGPSASISGTINNPTSFGSGFLAQDFAIFSGSADTFSATGASQEAQNNANQITCPNGAGVIDPKACKLTSGSTSAFTITGIAPQGNFPPPDGGVDLSNPVVDEIRGSVNTANGTTGFTFESGLHMMSVFGNPAQSTNTNTGVFLGNPSVCFLQEFGEELSGLDWVTFPGECSNGTVGVNAYFGYHSGNSHWVGGNNGAGANQGKQYDLIIDGRAGAGGPRIIQDVTFASRCSGCSPGQSGNDAAVLCDGTGCRPKFQAVHAEILNGGTDWYFRDGGGGQMDEVSGLFANGQSMVHIGVGSGPVTGIGSESQQGCLVVDDTIGAGAGNSNSGNSVCLTPFDGQRTTFAGGVGSGLASQGTCTFSSTTCTGTFRYPMLTQSVPASSCTESSNTVTCALSNAFGGFTSAGGAPIFVQVTGNSIGGYNGTWQLVSGGNALSLKYTDTNTGLGTGGGGTVNFEPTCYATDLTTAAPVKAVPTATNVVITGGSGAGATDRVYWICFPNPY